MKLPSLAIFRSVSFWYRFGIAGVAILSVYLIREKFVLLYDYPFLTDSLTIKFFTTSKTIVVPDNIFLNNKIGKIYRSIAGFCSAKEKSELTIEVESFCTEGKNIIVVKDESLCGGTEKCSEKSLDPLPALAEQFKYAIYVINPSKELIPIYVAWLFNEDSSQKVLSEGRTILKNLLETVPQFSSSFKSFSGLSSIKDMLKYYQLAASNANGMLHCTAKYLGNGSVPGSFQYWNKPEIKSNIGRSFDIEIIGLVWTPRTFGARVKLSKEELDLWGNDDVNAFYPKKFQKNAEPDKKPDFAPVKGRGSRAHLTLGVADSVKAVVTGEDLLEIVRLEASQKDWPTYPCKRGWLRDYNGGKWVLYFDEKITVPSLFDGVYNKTNYLLQLTNSSCR